MTYRTTGLAQLTCKVCINKPTHADGQMGAGVGLATVKGIWRGLNSKGRIVQDLESGSRDASYDSCVSRGSRRGWAMCEIARESFVCVMICLQQCSVAAAKL